MVGLGSGRRLLVNHYALRFAEELGGYELRHWELQGANASDGPWTLLRLHENDQSLQGCGHVAAWPVEDAKTPFSFFRILHTGKHRGGKHHLCLGGIELYGTLK